MHICGHLNIPVSGTGNPRYFILPKGGCLNSATHSRINLRHYVNLEYISYGGGMLMSANDNLEFRCVDFDFSIILGNGISRRLEGM